MKRSLFILAALLISLTANAQGRKLKATAESLVGIWQQVVVDPETGEVKRYTPYLKIINTDGTYAHVSEMSGKNYTFLNASGKWKVTSENTFIEYVERMHEYAPTRRREAQTFRLERRPDGVFMYSKYHTIGVEMGDIHEVWRKCGFISRKKAEKMWAGE